jgi:hypothetical protein
MRFVRRILGRVVIALLVFGYRAYGRALAPPIRRLRRFLDRSWVGFVALGVGVFCLALAPLIRYYVLPRVELMPLDQVTTSVSAGQGSYFDPGILKLKGPVPITVTTHVVGDVAAGEATGYAVWNISTRIDTPETESYQDPRAAYSWSLQHVISQRHTGVLVNCCGANPAVGIDVNHLPFPFVYLQFPYGVAKTTYDYWNPGLGNVFPIHFTGTTTVQGHELYRFTGTVPPTKIGAQSVPGFLIGLPNRSGMLQADVTYRDDGVEILVDPATGAPVRTSDHTVTTLRLPGSTEDRLTLLAANFSTEPASEQAVLTTAVNGGRELRLIGDTVPIGALCVGGVLVLAGAGLLVRSARRARSADA